MLKARKLPRINSAQLNIASSCGSGAQKRSRGYPVGDYSVADVALGLKARYSYRARSRAGYIRAGLAEVFLKILDLGLSRRARYDGLSLRRAGGYHSVLRRTDARIRQADVSSRELRRGADDLAAALLYLCTQCFHCIKMHIYRPRSELAAARKREPHLAASRQKCAHEQNR